MLAAVASFDGDGVLRFKRQVEAGLMADGHWLVGAAVGLLASRRDHHHCRQRHAASNVLGFGALVLQQLVPRHEPRRPFGPALIL